MVITIKMGRSLNINCAACDLLRCTFRRRSHFIHINRTAFTFGKKLYSKCCSITIANPSLHANSRKLAWSVGSSSDGGGFFNPSTETSGTDSGTRLNRAIRAIRLNFSSKVTKIRKYFAMKLLFFLVGFYCATAFATVIGQTGDWDILSAALAVVIVEGIGALMYRSYVPFLNKFRRLISMSNYWKAGLCLGLFLDSFKY